MTQTRGSELARKRLRSALEGGSLCGLLFLCGLVGCASDSRPVVVISVTGLTPLVQSLRATVTLGAQTDVEVFTTTSGPEPDDSALVVRQFRNHPEEIGPAPHSRSGPNHTRGNADLTAVLALTELLAGMPYEGFKCRHCGADENRRSFLGDPMVKATL